MGAAALCQGEELKEIMLRLQELNLLNANLLHQSLTLTNYCLSLITGDTGQMIYGEPGKKERQGYQPGRQMPGHGARESRIMQKHFCRPAAGP